MIPSFSFWKRKHAFWGPTRPSVSPGDTVRQHLDTDVALWGLTYRFYLLLTSSHYAGGFFDNARILEEVLLEEPAPEKSTGATGRYGGKSFIKFDWSNTKFCGELIEYSMSGSGRLFDIRGLRPTSRVMTRHIRRVVAGTKEDYSKATDDPQRVKAGRGFTSLIEWFESLVTRVNDPFGHAGEFRQLEWVGKAMPLRETPLPERERFKSKRVHRQFCRDMWVLVTAVHCRRMDKVTATQVLLELMSNALRFYKQDARQDPSVPAGTLWHPFEWFRYNTRDYASLEQASPFLRLYREISEECPFLVGDWSFVNASLTEGVSPTLAKDRMLLHSFLTMFRHEHRLAYWTWVRFLGPHNMFRLDLAAASATNSKRGGVLSTGRLFL